MSLRSRLRKWRSEYAKGLEAGAENRQFPASSWRHLHGTKREGYDAGLVIHAKHKHHLQILKDLRDAFSAGKISRDEFNAENGRLIQTTTADSVHLAHLMREYDWKIRLQLTSRWLQQGGR